MECLQVYTWFDIVNKILKEDIRMKKRITGFIIYIAATVVTIAAAFSFDINLPTTHMIGAFAIAGVLLVASMLMKVSDSIFSVQ